ncbi:MAG: SDR family NAD(P)-dependent oxidoreductase [Pseudomonadales bacterium]
MAITDFKDKTIIITGASAGVGAATARTFAKLGSNLMLVARGEQALSEIAKELESLTQVATIAMDVGDQTACNSLISNTVEQFGAIHGLINNAGMHRRGNVEERSADDLGAMVDINLRAPLFLTAAALPHLKQANGAAIVNVGSLAGRMPMQGAATYAATKAGLRSFTYGLADELREQNIAVGVVSPGPIDTGFIMDEIDQVEDIVYSQPMSTAEQVADAIIELARGVDIEISMPAVSGKLTTLSYLFPKLRRGTRKHLYAMGKKNKEKYRQRGAAISS